MDFLLSLEKPFKTGLGNLLHHPPCLLIGRHPSTSRCLQCLGNIDHLALLSHAQSNAKPRMKFASATFTSFFATDPVE
jgi:hypothetical protein